MVVVRLIKRVIVSEIEVSVAHMVCDNVEHDPHIALVAGIHKWFEILGSTEMLVYRIHVPSPVPMVSVVIVIDSGTNPDGIESHIGYVIEVEF
jgi:hypothetical protein